MKDAVDEIKKEMGECEIPVNINMRRNELDQLRERMERIDGDFADMKQADEEFEGNS